MSVSFGIGYDLGCYPQLFLKCPTLGLTVTRTQLWSLVLSRLLSQRFLHDGFSSDRCLDLFFESVWLCSSRGANEVVTMRFKQSAMNPAFNPWKGSCLVNIRNMSQPTPTTRPANTPRAVTRFQNRPSTTPGKNCAIPL